MSDEEKSGKKNESNASGEGGKKRNRRRRRRRSSSAKSGGNASGTQQGNQQGSQQPKKQGNAQQQKQQGDRNQKNRSQKRRRGGRGNQRSNRGNQRRKGTLTTKLSEHFTKEDFWVDDGEGRQRLKISLGLVGALEALWGRLDRPVTIVQGYITPEQAEKQGNWKRNFHPLGLAVDVRVEGLSLEELFLAAETIESFKGIGLDVAGNHVHLDVRNQDERVLWVVQNKEEVELTDALRKTVFKDVVCPELRLEEDASEETDTDAEA